MSISTIKTFILRSNFVCSSKLGLGDSFSLSTSESNRCLNNRNRSDVLCKIDYPCPSDFWTNEGWPFCELKPELTLGVIEIPQKNTKPSKLRILIEIGRMPDSITDS